MAQDLLTNVAAMKAATEPRGAEGHLSIAESDLKALGIVVESVPVVGRTWYRRGGAYWTRRAALSVLVGVGLVVQVLLITGLVRSIPTGVLRWTAIALIATFSFGTGTFMFRRMGDRRSYSPERNERGMVAARRAGT